MSARPDTWMPLYWGDYLRDTMHLRAEAHGAYLLLIGHYWTSGAPLPDDDEHLAAVARLDRRDWLRHRTTIQRFFHIENGAWRHKRIDAELLRARELSEARQRAGKSGGKSAANTRANGKQNASRATYLPEANGKQAGQQNPTQSQSQSHSQKQEDGPSQGKVVGHSEVVGFSAGRPR